MTDSSGQTELSALARGHLQAMRAHFDKSGPHLWPAQCYRRWLAHYYNLLIPEGARVLEIGCGDGSLLSQLKTRNLVGIDISETQLTAARKKLPQAEFFLQAGEEICLQGHFDYIIISDTLNLAADVQLLLSHIRSVARPKTRLLINFASFLWRPAFFLATLLGLRSRQPQSSWLAPSDMKNLLHLSDWEVIKMEPKILLPCGIFAIDSLFNRWLAPIMPWFCLSVFCIARMTPKPSPQTALHVSVIVPARNEAGNIANIINRMPSLGASTEIIFVEGHSTDNTWETIQLQKDLHPDRTIRTFQQTGRGKGDAVRLGFEKASGDILIILDADLTVPPEELPKFYSAIISGRGEFVNGVRLVYPMGKEAMRFLNLCANKLFSLAFSWLLGQPIKDTLCGTKVIRKEDYQALAANRSYFGEFDPFGDFDLLFGANKLNLRLVDIPIRYQDRFYGQTNINRWRDGTLLIRMVIFAARKIKFV